MHGMFWGAKSFNSDISKWAVSSVKSVEGMQGMFCGATSFNGDVSKWDVSSVNDMNGMFEGALCFDRDLSKWDVSSVTNMGSMFGRAASYNGDISKWDVSRVANMNYMFNGAASFKRKLCGTAWVHSKASKSSMFVGSTGSIPRAICMPARTYVSHRPIFQRELIARKSFTRSVSKSKITSTMTCPKCGTFEKSNRMSCCAPGGTWFRNCGGVNIRNVDHRWFEGVEACQRKFNANIDTSSLSG